MRRSTKIALAVSTVAAAALAVVLTPRPVDAATAQASFTVTAIVPTACTIGATNISVPSYDPNAGSAATAGGTVTLTCTRGTPYSVALASARGWQLSDAAVPTPHLLNYAILQGATANPWNTAQVVAGTAPSRAAIPLVATASIAAGQDVPVGTYTDTVTATVTF
jgi:spore coat protein U-like protein